MLFDLLLPLWKTTDRYPWFPGLKSGAGETKSTCADWTDQVNQPDAGQSGNNMAKSISAHVTKNLACSALIQRV
jgi:hypothetical protein